tara:strand:- start:9837 stop:10814 length:978 start_codon:yes stop_codon:yes gene_type:complete
MVEKSQVKQACSMLDKAKKEVAKVIVDQEDIVNGLVKGMLCGGHILVEGLPGLAKTLIVRTISEVSGCKFSRVQFTADLLPGDIVGFTSYEKSKGFYTIKGPIFSNFVLADEINRAPPKVQAALLESMQERQATIGRTSHKLPNPFFVLATENPIETLGVYPLPEAQIDRFLFKLFIDYPDMAAESDILEQNITLKKFEDYKLKSVLSPGRILRLQRMTKEIYMKDKVKDYVVRLVDATRNPDKYGIKGGKYIAIGAGPRGSIGLYIGAKATALLNGRNYVVPSDVKEVAKDVLRHRVVINYEGQASNVRSDVVVEEILKKVKAK